MKKNKETTEEIQEEKINIEILINENNELKEKLLIKEADFQNFKRRRDEETSRIIKYANEDIILKIIDTKDNFEFALKMDDRDLSDEVSKFLNGFKMIYTKITNMLTELEVKEIEAEGVEFNPECHNAVMVEENKELPSNVIIEVLQKGYIYKDKIIRPSMVKVNK